MNFSDPLGLLADCKTEGKPCQEDPIPSKMVILSKPRENMGSYTEFAYQLENKEGQPLTGSAYTVEEHLWNDRAATQPANVGHNSTTKFRHEWPDGRIYDQVGYLTPKAGDRSYTDYQTFTVRYGGKPYDLSTEFEHQVFVDKGRYSSTSVDIVP